MKQKIAIMMLFLGMGLCAAQTPIPGSNVTDLSITFPVFGLNPVPVPGASVYVVGQSGQATWYFWASANYQLGSVVSPIGVIQNAPNTLSSSNYVAIVPYAYPAGLTTVDILATTTPLAPTGACNCAVATGLTSGGANFQSNSLLSYTVSILNPQAFELTLTNEVTGTGATSLLLRNKLTGALIANLSSPSGSMAWPANAGIAVCTGSPCTNWIGSLTPPSGALVGTTDTQSLTNKTVDGVTPATFGFVDPTSSIQGQLSAKGNASASGMSNGQVGIANGASGFGSSKALVGMDAGVLSSASLTGVGVDTCTDSNGGASVGNCEVFNVKGYGALGDGSTNDAVAINAAITAASGAKLGIVFFSPGTYIANGQITIPSGVYLRGSGRYNTILKASASLSANTNFIISNNFGGTNCTAGTYSACPTDFGLLDITVDGNGNSGPRGTGTSNNLSMSGYRCLLKRVQIINAPNDGIYSEMAGGSNSPPYNGQTAIAFGNACNGDDIRTAYNAHNGFTDYGPTDSQWNGVIAFKNGNMGMVLGCVAASSGGTCATNNYISNLHNWNNTGVGLEIETMVQGNNIQSETNSGTCNIVITDPNGAVGNNVGSLQAGYVQVWNGGNGSGSVCGIKFDSPPNLYPTSGSNSFAGNIIDGLESHFNSGQGIIATSNATRTVISRGLVYNNGVGSGGGFTWAANDSKIDLIVKGNTGNGCDFSGTSLLSTVTFSGSCEGNTGTQLLYPTGASNSFFGPLAIFTGAGQTQTSGAVVDGLSTQITTAGTAATKIASGIFPSTLTGDIPICTNGINGDFCQNWGVVPGNSGSGAVGTLAYLTESSSGVGAWMANYNVTCNALTPCPTTDTNLGTSAANSQWLISIDTICTTAVSTATVNVNFKYTDLNGNVQTINEATSSTCTTISTSPQRFTGAVRVKSATTMTYAAVLTNAPTGYSVTVSALQLTTN